jgi:hypothetical protein
LCPVMSEALLPPRSMREVCLSRCTLKSCYVNLSRLTIGRHVGDDEGDDRVDGAVK